MVSNSFAGTFAKVFGGMMLAIFTGQAVALTSAGDSTIRLSGQYRTSGGQATYTLPIDVMPGRAGLQPELAFNYRSDRGNGTLGMGWQLSGLSAISRCGQSRVTDGQWGGVNFNGEDRYCLDGQRLIAVTGRDGAHRTEYRVEKNGYAKVISYGSVEGAPEYFKVWHKDGSVSEYGNHTNPQAGAVAKLPGTEVAYQWLQSKQSDITGSNALNYVYSQPGGTGVPLIQSVNYAGGKLTFNYADRQDTQRFYLGGKEVLKNQRLASVTIYNSANAITGNYQLSYKATSVSGRSLMEKIQYCASNKCATPITFDWQSSDKVAFTSVESTDYNAPRFYDGDGDGKATLYGVLSKNTRTGKMNIRDLAGTTHSNITSFTLTGSVLSPTVSRNSCNLNVAASYSDGNGNLVSYCRFSTCSGNSCKYASKGKNAGDFDGNGSSEFVTGFLTADFNGDGRDDKHRFDIPGGDYRYELSNGLTGALSSPGGRVLKSLADINRDGYLDVFTGPATGTGYLFVHHFTGTGFAPPVQLELQMSSEDDIHLADITGDGYPELVHKGKFYRNESGVIAHTQEMQPHSGTATTATGKPLKEPILDVGSDVYSVRDINGDGWADILTRTSDTAKVTIRYSAPQVQDKITRFNEYGLAYQVAYRPATDSAVYTADDTANETLKLYPYKQVTPARYLVAEVLKQPQGYDTTRYAYAYQGARSHLQGGGFLGFASISETETASVITRTVTEYKQDDLKLAGEPLRTLVYKTAQAPSDNDKPVSEVSYEYQTQTYPGYQAQYYQTYANKVTKTWSSPGQGTFDKKEVTTRTIDRFGNLTREVTNITSGHAGAGAYARTTDLSYLSTGTNQSRFFYTLSQQAGGIAPSTLSQYPAGLTRYCADNGETYFKPNDLFVLIGVPSTPILAKRYDEYFKYRSVSLTDQTDGTSAFSGDLTSATKAQFDAANAYPCGQMSVTYPSGSQSATLTALQTASAEIVTESPDLFWKLSAPVKETTTISDGATSRTTENTLSYHATGLLASRTSRGNNYGTSNTSLAANYRAESYQYDSYGNLTASTVSGSGLSARTTSYTYSNSLYPATTRNAKGHVSSTTYDANGRLKTAVSALKGRTTNYDYDVFGRATRETLPGSGNTNSTDYQLGTKCPYATAQTVSCTIGTSAAGGKHITLYDYAGRELRSLHQGFNGQWVNTRTTWDLSGRKTAVTRPHFVRQSGTVPTVTFAYDELNREIEKSEPASSGGSATFKTAYNGLKTESTDAKGNKHISTSNVMGYIIEKDEPGKDVNERIIQTYTYYPDGKLATSTDSSGNNTIISYDSLGHRSKLNDPDMGVWVYTYNAVGELTYKRDANNIATTITYDTLGRKVSQKEGTVTSTWQYDGNNAPGTLTYFSGRGQRTDYAYNTQGLTEEVSVTVGGEHFSTRYTYDSYERVTQEERPNGGASASSERLAVQYVYNPYGYLAAVRSPRSAADSEFSSTKFRSEIQQLLDEAIALANTYLGRAETYASQEALYTSKAQTLRSGTLNEHKLDSVTAAKLGASHKLAQWCTDEGECYLRPMGWVLIGSNPITPVEAVIEGDIYHIDSTYNQTTSGTRIHNATLTPVSQTTFDALTLTKAHDFVVKDMGNGQKSLFSEDDVYVASPDSATKTALAYTAQDLDEAATLAATKQKYYTGLADKLISLAEQVAVLSGLYCDDAKSIGGKHTRMANRWGNCGTPSEFGQADHLQLVLDQSQLDASAASGDYLYYWQRKDIDAYDHTLSEVMGNGLVNSYEHNAATGRPGRIWTRNGNSNIRELHYRYDAHNNVIYRNDLLLGITDNWTYDAQDRVYSNTIGLLDATRHGVNNPDLTGTHSFRYDKLGNITSKTGVGAYTYSEVNAGPHAVTKAGSLNYQYDNVGNLLRTVRDGSSASERTLTWTEFNKPASITRDGNKVDFFYDANHNRYLKKSSDGSETFYFGKTYERIKASNGEMQHKHFVYADGKLIALNTQTRDAAQKLKNKQVRYLHYDALNSVDMITDGYGNVVERRSYDTWGKQRAISWRSNDPAEVIQSAITNRGYTGHEEITEVNLIHMNGRIYDAELGRFLSADPHIQAPYRTNSFNRYSYVMNNPLKYTDPTGYFWSEAAEAVSDAWDSFTSAVSDFFSGGSSGNGSGNNRNDSDHDNLEGEGITYTLGYIGRALAGLVGGPGNTIDDQTKMAALTAEHLCRSGRCGESELRRIGAAADRFGRNSSFNQSWDYWANRTTRGVNYHTASLNDWKRVFVTTLYADLQILGGAGQMVLGGFLTSTGFGTPLGIPLSLHGTANMQEGLTTLGSMAGLSRPTNFMKEIYSEVGVGNYYNEIDLALSVVSLKVPLNATTRMPIEHPVGNIGTLVRTESSVSIYGRLSTGVVAVDGVNIMNGINNFDITTNEVTK